MRISTLIGLSLIASAYMPARAYTVYPVPQHIELTGKHITPSSAINIVTSDHISENTLDRLKEVIADAGFSCSVSTTPADGATDIYIGVYSSGDSADRYAAARTFDTSIFPARDGGYDPHIVAIDTDDDMGSILILGDDDGSAYYGCATLQQMFEQMQSGTLATAKVEDFAHAKHRGIMEGFYGHPYSIESRLNLLDFCKRYKLNYYGYGPKSDPYHAGNWRMDYPESITDSQRNLGQMTAADMALIAGKAQECNVDFVWIIHPSLGSYSIDLSWTDDIMKKFEHLYSLGIRHFGVSVDDMRGHPSNQGDLAAEVQKQIDLKWNTADTPASDRVGPILFTPTTYALNYNGSSYILPTFRNIDSKIDIAFTGYDCFSNVRASSFATMADHIGRDPIFWWNNPVNDDYDGFLYMHGLTARWTIENEGAIQHMKGFLLNPMNQGQASKVSLFSGADYAWNPGAFDADKSWEASLAAIVKTDRYTDALKQFIRLLSAYTTKDTTTPEGEEFAALYSAFKNAYPSTSFAEADELYSQMKATYQACLTLSELKESDDPDQRLFYYDIEPWLLKVKDMTQIVFCTIDLLNGQGDLDRWTDFSGLASKAAKIHTNHTFSVLEGSGTGTYEQFKEAQPTPRHLDPLIDFLATKIGKLSLSLPERSRKPELITNLDEIPGAAVSTTPSTILLDGIKDIPLGKNEYIGIYLNHIMPVTAPDLSGTLPETVETQHSVNGKQWTTFTPDGTTETEMAYFRIRNTSDTPITLELAEIPLQVPEASSKPVESPEASTNMGTYSDYMISNVADGDKNSFFWSSAPPVANSSYIMLDLKENLNISDIILTFRDGDQPSGSVDLQVSDDGSTWTKVNTFTADDITDNTYSFALSAKARYVRMFIATITSNTWLQLAEFEVIASSGTAIINVAEDHNGRTIPTLDDRSLTTGYIPTEAGSMTYRLIENLNINEIHIFHNSTFSAEAELPHVSIFADEIWHDMGTLSGPRNIFDTRDLKNMSAVRIEWNDVNRPSIYEIMPVGTPYVESAEDPSGITEYIGDQADRIRVTAGKGTIRVVSSATASAISSVTVTDMLGRTLIAAAPAAHDVQIPVHYQGIALVHVRLTSSVSETVKIIIP